MRISKSLLWIDCTGALVAGVLVLSFARWLSSLYVLPMPLVVTMGIANLAYGAFSLSLARRAIRPQRLLHVLILANLAWAVLCAIAAVIFARQASYFGLAQLLLEGTYVGGLGLLEWRHRTSLMTAL